jgi:hypothetical protein
LTVYNPAIQKLLLQSSLDRTSSLRHTLPQLPELTDIINAVWNSVKIQRHRFNKPGKKQPPHVMGHKA